MLNPASAASSRPAASPTIGDARAALRGVRRLRERVRQIEVRAFERCRRRSKTGVARMEEAHPRGDVISRLRHPCGGGAETAPRYMRHD